MSCVAATHPRPFDALYAFRETNALMLFGAGYNVLPIWKERLDAKTLVTTPNSDFLYALKGDRTAVRRRRVCGQCQRSYFNRAEPDGIENVLIRR